MKTFALLTALVAVPALAHADAAASYKDALTGYAATDNPHDCLYAYGKLHELSVPDTATVSFADPPQMKTLTAGTHTIAEVRDACQRAQTLADAVTAARGCLDKADTVKQEPSAQLEKDYGGAGMIREGKAWLAAIDAAGAKDSDTLDFQSAKRTFGDARAICNAYIAFGGKLEQVGAADAAAKAKAMEEKYTSAGVAGDKLKLFLEYDDVYWRTAPKCETEDDPKKLARAKALFQWLDNADGTVTIRKYQFAGNKVAKISNQTFTTADKAYKGCR